MNQSTQQLPSNPALDFANAILEETNGGLEIIDMLHDIAQGVRQNSTTRDRINASRILLDRGLGKCPKQSPVTTDTTPNPDPNTDHNPEPAEGERGACPEHVEGPKGHPTRQRTTPVPRPRSQRRDPNHALHTIHQPLSTPIYYPAAYSRNHQQRTHPHGRSHKHLPCARRRPESLS